MSVIQDSAIFLDEVAEFLASGPTPEQLVNYRPSQKVQERASQLLAKQRSGAISADEERELDQFVQAELLMQLVGARVRAAQKRPTS
jgi:hypothetical protein